MAKDVKILLADDDEEVQAALNDVLRSEGYEVITARNGREAIAHFYKGHIDIALLDLNMPVKGVWRGAGGPDKRATANARIVGQLHFPRC